MEIENIVTPCESPSRTPKGSPGTETVVLNYIEDVNIVVKETLTDIVNRVTGKNTCVNVGQKRKCVSCEEEINKRQKLEEENKTLEDRVTNLESDNKMLKLLMYPYSSVLKQLNDIKKWEFEKDVML